jgi:hypothetical protein
MISPHAVEATQSGGPGMGYVPPTKLTPQQLHFLRCANLASLYGYNQYAKGAIAFALGMKAGGAK